MPRLRLAHLFLVSLVALAGCDANENDLFGEFLADVRVDAQLEGEPDEDDATAPRLRGEAVYTIIDTPNGPEFVLGLFVGDLFDSQYDEYNFIVFRRPGGVPGVGGYAVVPDPQASGVTATYARVTEADEPLEAEGPVLRGEDGTLAITSVDGIGVITGTFGFDATGVFVQDAGRFVDGDANGRFEARYESPNLFFGRGLDL
ncbi:MAG: hypothetical protein AAFQ43_04120 [Bacteroidota bacterium]